MDSLVRYQTTKQNAYSSHRPCYPIPQNMSDENKSHLKNARDDLQRAYNKEIAKPPSQRNSNLVHEMSCQLQPRLCGW